MGGSSPIDPSSRIKPVEKIRPEERKKDQKPIPVSKKLFLYLAVLQKLQQAIRLFSNTKNKEKVEIKETPLHKELQTIKSSLESLQAKNLSNDPEFLNYFAFIWLKFLKDFNLFLLKDEKITEIITTFMHEINTFPKDAEFTLGFYLSEFAGYKWIPFPYIDILNNLHIEDQKEKENSHLSKWINTLNELLQKI